MDFPNFGQTRADMHIANLVHSISGILLMLLAFGHIYMGTIGVEGAFEGMWTGYVDTGWARQHSDLWYEEVTRKKGEHPEPSVSDQ